MIQLQRETSVALLSVVVKQNYGKAWTSLGDRPGFFLVGLHLPTGEVGYYVPEKFREYFQGMVETDSPDLLSTVSQNDAAERILTWGKTL